MRRADRLFQIIHVLQGRRLTTARFLAERLEVSERTIYRDIQDLSLSGVPIEGEAGVGYVLRGGFHLPPLMFTPEEMEALIVGTRIIDAWAGKKLAGAAKDALQKIESVLPPRLKHELRKPRVFAPSFPDVAGYGERLDNIREAINARCMVDIRYQRADGEYSTRRLWPLGLIFWGNVWTLAAWCELRDDYRTFRIDRIQKLDVTTQEFRETDAISLDALMQRYREEYSENHASGQTEGHTEDQAEGRKDASGH